MGGEFMDGLRFTLAEDNSEMLLQACRKQRERAFEIIGMKAEGYAKKKYCPVDTGRLRNSITHQVDSSIFVNSVTIGTNVEYGKYVEMGTSKMEAQPFLKPTIENHLSEYQSILENELKG